MPELVVRERYVAVDPGVTTGLVSVDLPGNWREMDLYLLLRSVRDVGGEWPSCRAMELQGAEYHHIDMIEGLVLPRIGRNLSASAVIIESFSLRERTKDPSLLAPVRLAARLEDRLYVRGYRGDLVYQSPSDAKSIVTDSRLKHWGLWHEGSPHIRDAWRHLIKYLRDNR